VIVGALAIALNFLSIALLGMLLAGLVLAGGYFLIRERIASFQPTIRRKLLWSIALAPWLIGLISSSIALLSGTSFSIFPESFPLLHWHHVDEFELFSWHGFLLAASILVLLSGSGRYVFRTYHQSKKLQLLRHLSLSESESFYYLDSNNVAAFTAGYFNPRCFISLGLLNQLSEQERSIIIQHELAHADRKDPFKKFLFQFLIANFPKAIRTELASNMSLVIEQCADDLVLSKINNRSLIASTLLKVNRLIQENKFCNLNNNGALCHYGLEQVELRILNLLNQTQVKSVYPYLTVLGVVTLSALLFGVSADLFHHLIEFTLSH